MKDKLKGKFGGRRVYKKDGWIFVISKTTRKKYDVYQKINGKVTFICSFGDCRWKNQFRDDIGEWSLYNHYNAMKREKWLKRFAGYNIERGTPTYFAMKYLWAGNV